MQSTLIQKSMTNGVRMAKTESTHSLCKEKYDCAPGLQFDWLDSNNQNICCYLYVVKLLAPNQSKRRPAIQWQPVALVIGDCFKGTYHRRYPGSDPHGQQKICVNKIKNRVTKQSRRSKLRTKDYQRLCENLLNWIHTFYQSVDRTITVDSDQLSHLKRVPKNKWTIEEDFYCQKQIGMVCWVGFKDCQRKMAPIKNRRKWGKENPECVVVTDVMPSDGILFICKKGRG